MSKSAIYAINTNTQTVAVNSTIPLTTIARRFGCHCNLSGNGVGIVGTGYYRVAADVVATPSAAGTVQIQLCKDGTPIPGATASATVAAVSTTVTFPIDCLIRNVCCADASSLLTLLLTGAESVISNACMTVEKI